MDDRDIYNPGVERVKALSDRDNGNGFSANIPDHGRVITLTNGKTCMLYEIKRVEGLSIVFIRYIHYESKRELLSLLAFAVQWWHNLRPSMVYFREKRRPNGAGDTLKKMGFTVSQVNNDLRPFDCKVDGIPCKCPVYEYVAYNIASRVRH